MEAWFEGVFGPRALFEVLGGEDVCFTGCLGEGAHIIQTVVVSDGAGPGASAIGALAVVQGELVQCIQNVVAVIDQFPVHQILGLHDGHAGVEMHGGAAHVVGIPYPYHGHVGHVGPNNGVVGFVLSKKAGGNEKKKQ